MNIFRDNIFDVLAGWLMKTLYFLFIKSVIIIFKLIYFLTIGWIICLFRGEKVSKGDFHVDNATVDKIANLESSNNQGSMSNSNQNQTAEILAATQRGSAIYVDLDKKGQNVFAIGSERLTGFTSRSITTTNGTTNFVYDYQGNRINYSHC